MAYTPTVWANGDVITATKLNKAENGIAAASVAELPSVAAADKGKVLTVDSSGDWIAAAGPFVFVEEDAEGTLSLTWQQIHDAMAAGSLVLEKYVDADTQTVSFSLISNCGYTADPVKYSVEMFFFSTATTVTYSCATAGGNPVDETT